MWHGKLFHIDLNGQHGPRYDQDLRFGAGNARGAFWVVDALLAGGYDGPVHFDYKPPRTEDDAAVWASAAAWMRNYLILREKARAFRADPQVRAALVAARVPELAEPTLAPGESWRDVALRRPGHRRAGGTGHGVRAPGPAGPGAPVRRPLAGRRRAAAAGRGAGGNGPGHGLVPAARRFGGSVHPTSCRVIEGQVPDLESVAPPVARPAPRMSRPFIAALLFANFGTNVALIAPIQNILPRMIESAAGPADKAIGLGVVTGLERSRPWCSTRWPATSPTAG